MSSSSSLAAARRRRAGGQQSVSGPPVGGPPGRGPPPSQSTRQSNPDTPNIPPNPLMILQQHHAKINMLDEQIKQLLSNQDVNLPIISSNSFSKNTNEENNENLEENTPTQQRFDLNEITDLLLSRIENQLDLKVFYENDQKLASQIDDLNKIIIQQQSTLNNLNKLLYFIISNLKLELKEESLATQENSFLEKENVNLIIDNHLDEQSEDSVTTKLPTFPKSVKIDLENNKTTEFAAFEEDDDASNYEPGTKFTEEGLPIPPVD